MTQADLDRLEEALCILADYEGPLKDRCAERGMSDRVHSDMCFILRTFVD